jgi:hypothetical protein
MLVLSFEILPKMFCIYLYWSYMYKQFNFFLLIFPYFSLLINTSLNNTKIPEVITAKCFHQCHNNKQFIPRVYMFINHKMTQRYIYFRFTRHALQLHHVTMLNYLHGYKRLCCQNLAYRQTEIKWSFFVEHLNSWFAGTHENHGNCYTTKWIHSILYIACHMYFFYLKCWYIVHICLYHKC